MEKHNTFLGLNAIGKRIDWVVSPLQTEIVNMVATKFLVT